MKKFLAPGVIGMMVLAILIPQGWAATHYVDSAMGNDVTHDGLWEDRAWQSVARVNAQSFSPGDRILFRRGGIWRETLVVPSSGDEGKDITFGAYSRGDAPIISGADVIVERPGENKEGHLWRGTLATEPTQVFVAGVRGLRVATIQEVNAERRWYWGAGILTVFRSEGSPMPTVEASVRTYCVLVKQSYITVEYLTLTGAAVTCLHHTAKDGLTVTHCRLTQGFVHGLQSGDEGPHNGGRIEDCEVDQAGGSGLQFAGRMNGWIIRGNHVHHCGQLHEGLVGAYKGPDGNMWQEWSAGIKYWGFVRNGYLGDLLIERNIIEDCGPQFSAGTLPHKRACGIWLDEAFEPTARPVIRRNLVRRNNSKGIFIEKSSNCDVYSNLCYDNAALEYTANLIVESNFGEHCRNNRIYNNTCVGGFWTMALNSYQGKDLTGNEFQNNIAVGSKSGANFFAPAEAANDGVHSSRNILVHSCFGAERPGFILWGTSHATYAAWEAAYGGKTFSVEVNPQFFDEAKGDYHLQKSSPCRGRGADLSGVVKQSYDGAPFHPMPPNLGAQN